MIMNHDELQVGEEKQTVIAARFIQFMLQLTHNESPRVWGCKEQDDHYSIMCRKNGARSQQISVISRR